VGRPRKPNRATHPLIAEAFRELDRRGEKDIVVATEIGLSEITIRTTRKGVNGMSLQSLTRLGKFLGWDLVWKRR